MQDHSAHREAAGRVLSRHIRFVAGLGGARAYHAETLEIARDVAKKLIESAEPDAYIKTVEFGDNFDYPLLVGL